MYPINYQYRVVVVTDPVINFEIATSFVSEVNFIEVAMFVVVISFGVIVVNFLETIIDFD